MRVHIRSRTTSPIRGVLAAALTSLLLVISPSAGAAAPSSAAEFPAGYEAYHTYAEVVSLLDATVAAYPTIARKFSIGQSYEGRQIWALKISDNVHLDEDEPEVLFDSLAHAREHMTVEMNVYLIRQLTQGYATDARVRAIVNSREIFIIPILNPDGQEYDIGSGSFKNWRKNRQPNAGGTVGTDLNRNFGFMWGCCGGSSGNPASITYRGTAAFSAPESRAYRDFVDSRVVGGRQQISVAISWHSYGEYVMWPYGYTRASVPKTMSDDDQRVLSTLGRAIAALNGYIPQQMSKMYLMDGDTSSWLYGTHRIFAWTLEMYPPDAPVQMKHFYPSPSVIVAETKRNRAAVLYLLEQAACPYAAAGLGATHCGPLNDDFETDRGWAVNLNKTDTASQGNWQRAIPQRTSTAAGVKQRAATPSGQYAWVTGSVAGANANANDVDGGLTSVLSPLISLTSGAQRLSFSYYFAHNARASSVDFFRIRVLADGKLTTVFERTGKASERNANWTSQVVDLDAFAGKQIRLVVEAVDMGPDSLIEAAFDNMRVYSLQGSSPSPVDKAPTVPAGLAGVARAGRYIDLSWNASSSNSGGTIKYRVFRNGVAIGTKQAGRTYTDRPANVGTYKYQVRAIDAAGNKSALSPAIFVVAIGNLVDTTPPTVPTGLKGSARSGRYVDLSWNASTDNSGGTIKYRVFRNGVAIGAKTTARSFTDRPADVGTYKYQVRAIDAAGNRSSKSPTISVNNLR